MQIPFSCAVGGTTLHSVVITAGRCLTAEVTDISHDMTQIVAHDAVIDADDLPLRGRGGRSFVFRFTGHRWHESNAAAAAFVLSHPYDPPVDGGAVSISIGGATVGYTHGIVTKLAATQDNTQTVTHYEVACTNHADS